MTVKYGAQLDYESDQKFYTLVVQVTDVSGKSSWENVIISVVDVNEPPVVTGDGLDNLVLAENSPAGCQVATVTAWDPESDALQFYLIEGSEKFTIDEHSGILLTLDTEFDYESPNNTFYIVVGVADGVSTPSPTISFNVSLTDLNEAPEFVAPSVGYIYENAPGGVHVMTLTAADPDNDDVSYSLLSYNNNFKVDGLTGNVTTLSSASLDYEDSDQHILDIVVTDYNGASTTAQVQISVSNVLEPPTFTGTMVASVDEDAPEGTLVMELQAQDPEQDSFSFSLVNSSR